MKEKKESRAKGSHTKEPLSKESHPQESTKEAQALHQHQQGTGQAHGFAEKESHAPGVGEIESHAHSCPAGGLGSSRFLLGLLVVLSLSFGIAMVKKYKDLEAKVAAGGVTASSEKVGPAEPMNLKGTELGKTLEQLGQKLASLKTGVEELEPLLKELDKHGIKVKVNTKHTSP